MEKVNLTILEKQALKSMLDDGYAFDGGNSTFLTYGVDERFKGVIPDLVKKGIISTYKFEGQVYISTGKGYEVTDIVKIIDYK